MKKINLLTIIFLVLAFIPNKIVYSQKGWSIEAVASPYFSMGNEYDYDDYLNAASEIKMLKKPTIKFNGGLNTYYFFNNNMGISLGIEYAQKGQNYKDYTWNSSDSISAIYFYNIKLNYLQMPILFHYNFNLKNNLSFTAGAGIYIAYLLNYNISMGYNFNNYINYENASGTTNTFGSTSNNYSKDYYFLNNEIPFYKLDYGFMFKAGIEYKINSKFSLPVLINYSYGIKDIVNNNSILSEDNIHPFTTQAFPYYWMGNYPITTFRYHNSSLGISVALKYKF